MVPVPTTCTIFFFAAILADCSNRRARFHASGTFAAPMPAKPDAAEKLIASNRKAFHDYFVLQKMEAGIALTGTEVKALREGKANLKDSYVNLQHGEAYLFG